MHSQRRRCLVLECCQRSFDGLIVRLIDERPEEVTDMQRSVKVEVV